MTGYLDHSHRWQHRRQPSERARMMHTPNHRTDLLRTELARTIWETSRADESTISATGADIVAAALMPIIRAHLTAAWREGRASVSSGVKNPPYDL